MSEEFELPNEEFDAQGIERFEQMIKEGNVIYFDVEVFEQIVEHYIRQNKIMEAVQAIEIAEQQHPFSTILQIRKAQMLSALGKNSQAFDIIQRLEHLESDNYEVYLTKGTILSQMDRPGEAIANYNKAIELAGDDADEVLLYIAFEYENIGRYDKAIEYLKKSAQLNPENDAALYELAFCFDLTEQYQAGVEFYTKMTDERPFSAAAWYNLGLFYSKQEKFETAIQAYDYALLIHEEFSSAYFNKANALANMGLFKEAIETYQETFKYEEPDPVAFQYIAECYENLNDNEKALKYFHKAVKAEPALADAWCGMGVVLDEMARSSEAVHHLQKAVAIEPHNAEYWYILGDLYMKTGFGEEGEEAYARVTELEPDNVEIWADYVKALRQNEKYDEAVEACLEGIKSQPGNTGLYFCLSALLIEGGSEKQGLQIFEEALVSDYEKHIEAFDVVPSLKKLPALVEMLEVHKH